MKRRILALVLVQAVVGSAVLTGTAGAAPWPGADRLLGFTAAFALAGLLPLHLEFRRGSHTILLDEAVWIVALFAMTPLGTVACAVGGDLLSRLATRQSPLKSVYNLSSTLLAGSVGAALFTAFGPPDAANAKSWLAAVVAVTSISAVSLLSISFVLSMVEERPLMRVARDSFAAQSAATGANVSLGLVTTALLAAHPLGPMLLLPLLASARLAASRRALQESQQLRFERLYAAAARTGQLQSLDEVMAALAAEARGLLTGSVGVCCARLPSGEWSGVRVDDQQSHPVKADLAAQLVKLTDGRGSRTVARSALGRALRTAFPTSAEVVVTCSAAGPAPMLLAVFREMSADEQGHARDEVLDAFASHAALTIANAILHAELGDALQRQIDLNRQKSEFVAAVSHELRTPLATTLAAVATVQRLRGRLDEQAQHDLLARATDQGNRLRSLIDELLLVAAAEHRTAPVTGSRVDVTALVAKATAGFPEPATARLRSSATDDVGQIVTDEEKVCRLLLNLIGNALKYAPDGPIEVAAGRSGPWVELSVTDHGPGISPADRERVFEPFVQLDGSSTRRQGGTGLGLHLCRRLAEAVGGELTLDEVPGGGCRFTLALPADAPIVAGPEVGPRPLVGAANT